MNILDAVVQTVEFIYSAVISYAKTPEGAAHLDKLASDLGVLAPNQTDQKSQSAASDYSNPTDVSEAMAANKTVNG